MSFKAVYWKCWALRCLEWLRNIAAGDLWVTGGPGREPAILGRFLFNPKPRFEFSATSSSKWNSIFQNFPKRGQPRKVYPNFRKRFPGSFLSIQLLPRNFLNFRLNGSYFGNSTVYGISGNFSGKFPTICRCFQIFERLGWMESAPNLQVAITCAARI